MKPWLHAYTLHDLQGRSGGVQQVAQLQQALLRAQSFDVSEVAATLGAPVDTREQKHLQAYALPGAGIKGLLVPRLIPELSRLRSDHSGTPRPSLPGPVH